MEGRRPRNQNKGGLEGFGPALLFLLACFSWTLRARRKTRDNPFPHSAANIPGEKKGPERGDLIEEGGLTE